MTEIIACLDWTFETQGRGEHMSDFDRPAAAQWAIPSTAAVVDRRRQPSRVEFLSMRLKKIMQILGKFHGFTSVPLS